MEATSISSSNATRQCRSRPSSRASLSPRRSGRPTSRASPKSARPTLPIRSSSIPTSIKPDDLLAEIKKIEAGGRGRPRQAHDAHHRDSRALQRSLDARDLDALPRSPPGARHDRHRIYRQDQPSRRRRRLRQGAFRRALVRFDGRLRRRPAVPLPDGGAQAAAPVAEISAPAHRHAQADHRPWRLLRLHLFGARRRRLSDVRHHADADLRSQSRDQLSARLHVPVQSGRHRQMAADRASRIRFDRRRRRGGQVRAKNGQRRFLARRLSTSTSTEPTPG